MKRAQIQLKPFDVVTLSDGKSYAIRVRPTNTFTSEEYPFEAVGAGFYTSQGQATTGDPSDRIVAINNEPVVDAPVTAAEALADLLTAHVDLLTRGDPDNEDFEQDPVVINARAALVADRGAREMLRTLVTWYTAQLKEGDVRPKVLKDATEFLK